MPRYAIVDVEVEDTVTTEGQTTAGLWSSAPLREPP